MSLGVDDLSLTEKEKYHLVYQLLTLYSLLTNRKVNIQQLFVACLSDVLLGDIAKSILEEEFDIGVARTLLEVDPTLMKSKIVTTFTQKRERDRAKAAAQADL